MSREQEGPSRSRYEWYDDGIIPRGGSPVPPGPDIDVIGVPSSSEVFSNSVLSFNYEVVDDGSANKSLVVSFTTATTPTVNSVTFGGIPMTAAPSNSSASQGKLFYLLDPPVGFSTIVITLSASQTSIRGGAITLKNIDQVSPIGAEFDVSFTPGGFPAPPSSDQTVSVPTPVAGQFGVSTARFNASDVNVNFLDALDGATERLQIIGTTPNSYHLVTKPYSGVGGFSVTHQVNWASGTMTVAPHLVMFNRA